MARCNRRCCRVPVKLASLASACLLLSCSACTQHAYVLVTAYHRDLDLHGRSAAHLHPKASTTLNCSHSCHEAICQTMTQGSEGRCACHELLLELF